MRFYNENVAQSNTSNYQNKNKQQNSSQNNSNQKEIDQIYQLKNTSSFLSLSAVLLSIKANKEEYIANIEDEVSIKRSQDTTLIALYLVLIAILIDLGLAKRNWDEVYADIEKVDPLRVKAANDLLVSRITSVIATTLLIRSLYRSIEARQRAQAAVVPNIGVPI
jgi:hypothetical protein